jgi:hypothetical protein
VTHRRSFPQPRDVWFVPLNETAYIPKPILKLRLSVVGQSSDDQEAVGRQRAIRPPLTSEAALHEMANLSAVRATCVDSRNRSAGKRCRHMFMPSAAVLDSPLLQTPAANTSGGFSRALPSPFRSRRAKQPTASDHGRGPRSVLLQELMSAPELRPPSVPQTKGP